MPANLSTSDPNQPAAENVAGTENAVTKNAATNSAAGQQHIPALDGLRGFAILLVTVFRFTGGVHYASPAEGLGHQLSELGARGVDLFLVLSGFLITGILLEAKGKPHFFRNFYARRSLRIFPLYYGALFAALVILPLLSSSAAEIFAPAQVRQGWLWLYGTNILQSLEGSWPLGCLNHFWSLAVEEHFYLIWPVVILCTPRRSMIAACLTVIVVSAVSRVGWLVAGGNDVAPLVFTLFRSDALAMGALTAVLVREIGLPRLAPLAGWGLVILGGGLAMLTLLNRRFLSIPDTLFALFFACLLIVAVNARSGSLVSRFWNARPLRFFGKFSYAMYVFQYPLIPLLAPILSVEILAEMGCNVTVARLVYLVAMTGVTTLTAIASWHLYEKHFLAFKRHFCSPPSENQLVPGRSPLAEPVSGISIGLPSLSQNP